VVDAELKALALISLFVSNENSFASNGSLFETKTEMNAKVTNLTTKVDGLSKRGGDLEGCIDCGFHRSCFLERRQN
jgi:hypothetical protein